MKKLLILLLCAVMLLTAVSCSSDTKSADKVSGNSEKTSENSNENTETEKFDDPYVAVFCQKSYSSFNTLVRRSGETEEITGNTVKIADNGEYAIYQNVVGSEKCLYRKEPGKEAEVIMEGYSLFRFDPATEKIATAGEDGIFYVENPYADFVKVSDLSLVVSLDSQPDIRFSEDKKNIVAEYGEGYLLSYSPLDSPRRLCRRRRCVRPTH